MLRIPAGGCCLGLLLALDFAAAQPVEPKPGLKIEPKMRRDYELRIIRVGNTFQGLRFRNSTGESWMLVTDKFEKIPETGFVPAGDYEITLITDDNNWMAFRIDRLTGATWQLKNRQWNKMKEPE